MVGAIEVGFLPVSDFDSHNDFGVILPRDKRDR